MTAPVLDVKGLRVSFPVGRRRLVAVNAFDLTLGEGQCVGLVGESGSGKSTVAHAICGLVEPDAGSLLSDGQELAALGRLARSRRIQMVFQDPNGSLNPRLRIGAALREVLAVHGLAGDRVESLLERVGLDAAFAQRYPHELSGGQRQRVGLARALAVRPRVLIADEPVSALDVSVQVQILALLRRVQQEDDVAVLFISHDLATVRHMCDDVHVMYVGSVVEHGPTVALFNGAAHPYTRALLQAVPDVARGLASREAGGVAAHVAGEPPVRLNPPPGCVFHPRCPIAADRCREDVPELRAVTGLHAAACHSRMS